MPLLFSILILVALLGYEIKKSSKASAADSDRFWERESESLMTPRKSIADVRFITLPDEIIPDELPASASDDSELLDSINSAIRELKALSSEEIADLSDYTNTDLRIRYGTPNFTRLSNADTRFTRLVQLLPRLISELRKLGRTDEAAALLEFCNANSISTGRLTRLNSETKD